MGNRDFRKKETKKPCITLCCGSACNASGSEDVAATLEEEIKKQGLGDQIRVRKTGCHGFCERGPIIVNQPDETTYLQIKPESIPEIVSHSVRGKKVLENLLYTDPESGENIIHESEIPFFG